MPQAKKPWCSAAKRPISAHFGAQVTGYIVSRESKKSGVKRSRSTREDDTLYSRDTHERTSEDAAKKEKRLERKKQRLAEAKEVQKSVLMDQVTRRWTKFTLEKRREFIRAFRTGLTVQETCDLVEVSMSSVYLQRKKNPKFSKLFDEALNRNIDSLEDHLFGMATGRAKGNILAAFGILRANRPEKWRESSKVEHSGNLTLVTPESLQQARARVQQFKEQRERESEGTTH
jgi:hypothetical protein